jgi:hypothetical protein
VCRVSPDSDALQPLLLLPRAGTGTPAPPPRATTKLPPQRCRVDTPPPRHTTGAPTTKLAIFNKQQLLFFGNKSSASWREILFSKSAVPPEPTGAEVSRDV